MAAAPPRFPKRQSRRRAKDRSTEQPAVSPSLCPRVAEGLRSNGPLFYQRSYASALGGDSSSESKETADIAKSFEDLKLHEDGLAEGSKRKEDEDVEQLKLVKLEAFKKVCEDITAGTYKDASVVCREAGIKDEEVGLLVKALSASPHTVKRVDLSYNNITDEGAAKLAKIALEELNVAANNITHRGAQALSLAPVSSLDLSANPLGVKGARAFHRTLHIKKLALSECAIGDDGAALVLQNYRLKSLDLSTNGLTDEMFMMAVSLSHNREWRPARLEELNVSQNEFTSRGAQYFVNLMMHPDSPLRRAKKVDFSSNKLGDEGAIVLAQSGIPCLGLMQNGITRLGFLEIIKQTHIQEVNLFNNRISFNEDDLKFPQNTSLISLDLGSNQLDDKAKTVLKAIASIPTLGILGLTGNRIGDTGATILHQYKAKSVRKVDLFDNQIEDPELITRGFEATSR
jgi:Leucine-rich repeat (LRR) protein